MEYLRQRLGRSLVVVDDAILDLHGTDLGADLGNLGGLWDRLIEHSLLKEVLDRLQDHEIVLLLVVLGKTLGQGHAASVKVLLTNGSGTDRLIVDEAAFALLSAGSASGEILAVTLKNVLLSWWWHLHWSVALGSELLWGLVLGIGGIGVLGRALRVRKIGRASCRERVF